MHQPEEHYRDSRKDERLGTESNAKCSGAAVDLFWGMPHLLTSSVMPGTTKCGALINGKAFSRVVA